MLVVDEQQSGASVDVPVGEELAIRLKENAATGYRWAFESSEGLTVEESVQPGGAAPGAAGVHEFRVRASTPGSRQLRLKHWRDWQGEDSVTGRFDIQVRFG